MDHPSHLVEILTQDSPDIRHLAIDEFCRKASLSHLQMEIGHVIQFCRDSQNLYRKVRGLFFLHHIYRFHLPEKVGMPPGGRIPWPAYQHFLNRRFEEALAELVGEEKIRGISASLCSALAATYREFALQHLADQVRNSVRLCKGNQWMFRVGHSLDHPLRLRPELKQKGPEGLFPILTERTPVRMDLTHSAWSDIFYLAMDYPEGAQVVNISIDLAVLGRDSTPKPPIETYLRVIQQPILRLVSVDLDATVDLTEIAEVFDFAKDHLGLLKAAVVAAGIVPPGLEGTDEPIADLMARVLGERGLGLEIVSSVNRIPKGSRLAVSTNLLASLISLCMRSTSQASALTGPLSEEDRQIVLVRAILGEWLGGSGGGWQDSGGVWPGIKLIQGALSAPSGAERETSRGRLLPIHTVMGPEQLHERLREQLQQSLVLLHGGLAQNVGPLLEMVTEKYLLRSAPEWIARQETKTILHDILSSLKQGDIRKLAQTTHANFHGPIQSIIPWANNFFTDQLIRETETEFGESFWGFLMLGGMSGGGMGFFFDPSSKARAQLFLLTTMQRLKDRLQQLLPFAMDPVVYDFQINEVGTTASLEQAEHLPLPSDYYAMSFTTALVTGLGGSEFKKQPELSLLGRVHAKHSEISSSLIRRILPKQGEKAETRKLQTILSENGFDAIQHESIRNDLLNGRIGLNRNRLPTSNQITAPEDSDVFDATTQLRQEHVEIGEAAIRAGKVGVVTLAAGAGSRWTQGSGTVKALHPFARLDGAFRTFLEAHLAKSRKTGQQFGVAPPHIFTTSYLTHPAIAKFLKHTNNYQYPSLWLSPGKSIGLRMIPTVRDLQFFYEETSRRKLDEQKEKIRNSGEKALMDWAAEMGEAADYTDNTATQCLHPVGHWYEIPNLLKNGTLTAIWDRFPNLEHLLLHNIDTLGANIDPGLLGYHILSNSSLTFEVINRMIEDTGGGLASVDGRLRIVEALALPSHELEWDLPHYNSMTTWIHVKSLLRFFGLSREDLSDATKVDEAIRSTAKLMPTYVTIKETQKRWGNGHVDIFPVCQFEKLWSDMTLISDLRTSFAKVSRKRGQQLKMVAQLDTFVQDGSIEMLNSLCAW